MSAVRNPVRGLDMPLPRGLPERLPDGEQLLWQGAPDWRMLARSLFKVRGLALYFSAIIVVCLALDIVDGRPLQATAMSTLQLAGAALGAIGFLVGYAWLISRAAVYSITSQRVVLKVGLAVPMTINLPFSKIESVAMKPRPDGCGDITLTLNPTDRIAYFVLWPHARPWRMARGEPTFRAIPDAAHAGQVLARALATSAGLPVPTIAVQAPSGVSLGHKTGQTSIAA